MTDHISEVSGQTPTNNGFDPDALIDFVKRAEAVQAELDEMALRHKEEADPLRQDLAQVRREAVDHGFGKREFAAVLKRRRHELKAEHAGDALDLAQRANYQAYLESLERLAVQLPGLGEAALERARAM